MTSRLLPRSMLFSLGAVLASGPSEAGEDTLWDNVSDVVTDCSNTTREVFGIRRTVLDDFEVPDGEIWRVTGLHHVHYWNTLPPGTGTGLEFLMRSDLGQVPGPVRFAPTVTGYEEMANGETYFSRQGAESWTEFEPFELGPGRHWFEAAISAPGAGDDNRWMGDHDGPLVDAWINWEHLFGGPVPGSFVRGAERHLSFLLVGEAFPVALEFAFPNGRPDLINPAGDGVRVVITARGEATLDLDSPTLHYDAGAGFVAVPMERVTFTVFDAVFPAIDCGAHVRWFVTAATTDGETRTDPVGARAVAYRATAASGFAPIFADDFETDRRWTVDGEGAGRWERGVPLVCEGDRSPDEDGDGSGQCFLTGNGNCVDVLRNATTILTSPVLGAVGPGARVRYHRWFFGNRRESFVAEVSGDGGATWRELERVEPLWPEADGGWFRKELPLGGILDEAEQLRIRFVAASRSSNAIVEAAVDGVELLVPVCSCLGDIDEDGDVDVGDLLLLLAAWGPCPPKGECREDLDGSGVVDFGDLLVVLAAWGPCP